MKKYQKFYDDELWVEAYQLQKEVFKLVDKFPNGEKYGLKSQVLDSSNSVMANLAEDHDRYYYGDKVRVLYIVRGEMGETQSHLICAVSRNYIKKEDAGALISRYEKLKIRLNGRIKNFIHKKEKQ